MDKLLKDSERVADSPLAGRAIAIVGKLSAMGRKQAVVEIAARGGSSVEKSDLAAGWIVLGEGESSASLDDEQRQALARGELEVLGEAEFWQRLGLVSHDPGVRQLYTPAMLAELLSVPVSTIRGWQRRGLIEPARQVHRLAYFDFRDVQSARRLKELLAAGVSPQAIQRQLDRWREYLPEVERPLAELPIVVEGGQLLLRRGAGLIEAGGQQRLDFETEDAAPLHLDEDSSAAGAPSAPLGAGQLRELADELEEAGDLPGAIETVRAALSAGGPDAEVCFRLAELLYQSGDLSAARERYYMAIEIDEEYAEARANLGCLLLEAGERDLAIAAFEGALACHPDYPDVHYQLARALDEANRADEAIAHWRQFLKLAPESPWTALAEQRLGGQI